MTATAEQRHITGGQAVAGAPPRTIEELHHALGTAARRHAPTLDEVDVDAAVHAAAAACADDRSTADPASTAEDIGRVAAAMTALELPTAARAAANWSGFGALIPVLSGSPGAGASVVAAALADVLQLAGRCVLLVDAADPARSGLAAATSSEGPWLTQPDPQLAIRYSWRGHALVARLESSLPTITPGMVPPPPVWLPELDPLHVTVADIGHDGWRAAANPLVGAGGWLRRGAPCPRPLLVVRATRPSLRHAEQVLARLDPWIAAGSAVGPYQLVVTGAKRWPAGVAGAAGHRLAELVERAVFIPHDTEVEVGGITDELLPDKILDALAPLAAEWGLIPPLGRSSRRHSRTQGRH